MCGPHNDCQRVMLATRVTTAVSVNAAAIARPRTRHTSHAEKLTPAYAAMRVTTARQERLALSTVKLADGLPALPIAQPNGKFARPNLEDEGEHVHT